jgi:tetratricopeptide (TPR) repeat protein
MQAALVAEYADTQVALDRFKAKADKGDTAAVYGMGRLYLRQGNLTEGLPYLQQAASLDSASPFILSSLGAAYFQLGKLAEAQKVLRTALLLNPTAFSVHYRLASVLMELGQKEEALEHLQQIEDLSYIFLDIDYQLGVVLGRVNKLGLAHYHLGRYYQNKRDLKLAAFHYGKAKSLLRDSPEKAAEVDHLLKEIEKEKKKVFWEMKR